MSTFILHCHPFSTSDENVSYNLNINSSTPLSDIIVLYAAFNLLTSIIARSSSVETTDELQAFCKSYILGKISLSVTLNVSFKPTVASSRFDFF